MANNLSPWPRVRFMDANGNPASGGKLYTYKTGTSSPKDTYSDSSGTLNANPVILDSEGYADVWLADDVAYRFRLENSLGALQWQRDNINGAASVRTVDTIADLRLTGGSSSSRTIIEVLGYYAVGDLGGGQFWWDSASTATDDSGTIIKATAIETGRWKRIIPGGYVSLRWFGAKGDASNDDSTYYQTAIDYSVTNGYALYVPKGTYIIGIGDNLPQVTLTTGASFTMYGDGPELSVIKESADKGNVTGATACKLLYITAATGQTANDVMVRDITFDKNGVNTPDPTTPHLDPYYFEQAHAVAINIKGTGVLKTASFVNVVTRDKIGGGIVLAEGRINEAYIANCHGLDNQYTGGARGDVEFQAGIQNLTIHGCTGDFIQAEPNVGTPLDGIPTQANLVSCRYGTIDIGGYSGDNAGARVNITGCTCDMAIFYDALVTVSRSDLVVASVVDGSSKRWFRLAKGSYVADSRVRIYVDTGTNALSPWYFDGSKPTFGMDLSVTNCRIEGGTGMLNTTTGYAVYSPAYYAGSLSFSVRFSNCDFDPLLEGVLNADRNGIFEFNNCRLSCRSSAFYVGAQGGNYGRVTMSSCDISGVGGALVTYGAVATDGAFVVNGDHPYSKFNYVISTGTLANAVTCTSLNGNWTASAVPAADGMVGQTVILPKSAYGTASDYVATTSSETASTWRMKAQNGVKMDTTANRPTPAAQDIGLRYLDTTLDADGKPISWNGTAWVDATGLVV